MRADGGRVWSLIRRPLAVIVVVVFALIAPTWLWFVRGRKLPVNVTLSAGHYTASAGSTVSLRARIWPTPDDVEMVWEGPGVRGEGDRARWRLPQQLGVHTAKLTVRRSGAWATDAISVRVTASDPARCAIDRPPSHDRPPLEAPRCRAGAARLRPTISLHGEPCWGGNIVARVHAPRGHASWLWWTDKPMRASPGPLANLRLPARPASPATRHAESHREISALVVNRAKQCTVLASTTVAIRPCQAGPIAKSLLSDFRWELIGPSSFRFVAKPPRGGGTKAARYRWGFGDGQQREASSPVIVHRYDHAKPQYLVSLETITGRQHATTIKAVTDRSVDLTKAAGASRITH